MPNTPDSDQRDDKPALKRERPAGSVTAGLAAQIAKARRGSSGGNSGQSYSGDMTGAGKAFRFASEFIAAIVIGALLGLAIDAGLGTTPWAMIILLLVGFAAGVRNVIRVASEQGATHTTDELSGSAPEDRDED